jgi:aspartyl-tRNA(Asn)/glutamyl-tRNA(Gln) amidotransferase subunit A
MAPELYRLTGHAVRQLIRTGGTSARAVTESVLSRINAVDSKVDAYVDVWSDSALERADSLDKAHSNQPHNLPLLGFPIAIKDVICTTRGTTTCGSQILKGYRSPFNATVIERLEKAGAIFLGKTNMDEFAMGSSTENSSIKTTKNPWNLRCVPGGSSGGSAAAVSADTCAVALGSDTGGSIRQPAAMCGCVGLKPTYGRVSRYGLVAFASSLDQIGPFSKDVRDTAEILNVICGRDVRDSTSADIEVPDFTSRLGRDIKGMRIGLPKEYYTDALNPEMRAKIMTAIKVVEGLGAEVVEISLPHTDYAVAVYYVIATAEASANLARFDGVRYAYRAEGVKDVQDLYCKTRSQGFGREVQRRILLGTYVLSSGYYDAYYLKAQRVRSLIRRDFTQAFERCDVIACPTSPSPAFELSSKTADPLEMYLSDIYTISANLAGLPGISIPCGLTSSNLPAGLQLMGKPFDEATLLQVAHAYEQNRGFELGVPPLN